MRSSASDEDYFDAAMDLLGGAGAGPLTLPALCARLGVTTGSFYGHFASFDDFVTRFTDHWDSTTFALLDIDRFTGDHLERVRQLKLSGGSLPHGAEGAIRARSRSNPIVAAAQARVDARRVAAVRAVIEPLVGAAEADRLAHTGLTLLAGLHTLHSPPTAEHFEAVFDLFEDQILTSAQRRTAAHA